MFSGHEVYYGLVNVSVRFIDATTVEMTDPYRTARGTYVQNSDQVILQFGACTYVGQIRGNEISGIVSNPTSGRTWTFRIATNGNI